MDTDTISAVTTPLGSALQAIDASLGANPDDKQLLIAAKVRALMRGYDTKYRSAGYRPFAVEEHIENSLINPETNHISRTFKVAGKLDVLATYRDKTVLIDHKSTSSDISDPNSPYWQQLVVEAQPSSYMLQAWTNGIKIDTAVWDVLRKPATRPKELKKGERAKIVADRAYFGVELPFDELERLQTEDRESIAMYEARLTHDCTVERPEWFFQRRAVPRTDRELHEYAVELWEHGQEILHARNTNRHARNSGACMLYGSPCKFLGICSGHDTSDSDKWQKKINVHVELPQLAGDGRDTLTNSRVRCFQTCRRRHYYSYELGIERQDEEEKEALYFGTLWHVAQQSWWTFLMGECNGDNSTEPPANAVGSSSGVECAENVTRANIG